MIKLKHLGKKKILISSGIIALIVAGTWIGISSKANTKSGQDTTQQPISAVALEKRDLSKVVGANGVVESENVSKITTSITSNVKELNVQPGDKVQEGDILCVFDDATIKSEIKKLEETIALSKKSENYQAGMNQRALQNAQEEQGRQVDKANTGVSQAQSDLDSANDKISDGENKLNGIRDDIKSVKKQIKKLKEERSELKKQENQEEVADQLAKVREKIASLETELTELEASYTQAEGDLSSLRDGAKTAERAVGEAKDSLDSVEASSSQSVQAQVDTINQSKFKTDDSDNVAQLEKLKTNLDNTVIKAPISGTVTYLNIEKGSPASEGVIMKIENTDALKISVKIKEYDILNIKEGMKATVTSDAIPNITMEGAVSKIYLTPIAADANATASDSTTREYAAEISLNEKNSDLLIGMNTKAKIVLEENKDVFAVPYEAVTTNEANQNIVYAAIDDGKGTYTVKAIPVEKGIETDYYAAISAAELKEGMVIVSTPELVTEGSTISVQLNDSTNTSSAGTDTNAGTSDSTQPDAGTQETGGDSEAVGGI